MSTDDRKRELEAALVATATNLDMDDAKRISAMAATRAQLRRLGLVATAKVIVAEVSEQLADADDTISDATRIALMSQLREAINNIHEAS